jgi:uncharacterized protein (DUF305 family)
MMTSRMTPAFRAVPLGALLITGTLVLAACSSDPSAHGEAHDSMTSEQTTAEQPGVNPADVMFAQMMIPHHEQAVVMSDLADSRASDPVIVDLAREIKGAQAPEIELMGSWLDTWGAERLTSDDAMGEHGSHGMAGMLSDEQLDALAQAQGAEFDALFAQAMIEHHQGAVQMARDVLEAGADPDVAALAREIIVTQEKEILQLQSFLGGEEGSAAAAATVPVAPALGHVHGAVVDGDDLVVGTHDGVHRVSIASGQSELVGMSRDDFMGFTGLVSGTVVASGHPGPVSELPNPLGLLASEDGGATWESRSLLGEVDFHGLAVSGDQVVGWDTRGPLQWSSDGGRTWTAGPTLTPTSLTWFGEDVWLATPDLGLVTWRPGSAEVVPVDSPGVLVASASDGTALWRVDIDGTVHRTTDGSAWEQVGAVTSIEALAADADRAYAVTATGLQIVA